jgi:hypothetical protein
MDGYAKTALGIRMRWEERSEVAMLALTNDHSKDELAFQNCSSEMRGNRKIVLVAVSKHGQNLEYASDELKNDREVVLAAVSRNGNSLEYASDELKNDREVVMLAIANDHSKDGPTFTV